MNVAVVVISFDKLPLIRLKYSMMNNFISLHTCISATCEFQTANLQYAMDCNIL